MKSITKTILIADDEVLMRQNLREILHDEGYKTIEAESGTLALELTLQHKPDLVLLDIKMPGLNGMQVLDHLKREQPGIPVIIFTAYGTSERPIEAMKAGAYDYIEKPFDLDDLLLTIKRAVAYSGTLQELHMLRQEVHDQARIRETLIGSSSGMQAIFKMVGKIANSDTSVLIQGETGSGKEMIADAIQRYSGRADGPYIKVNCAALPESLLESELFGHEAGAFTGAVKRRIGRFELAHRGTIFLDEIDSMSPSLQVKLLRVLQQQTFERVGGEQTLRVDLRVLCATNQHLEEDVRTGKFREDLFYRLNVIHLRVPPLREHREDIPALVDHFLDKYHPAGPVAVGPVAMDMLMNHEWPGNVRELENSIQRALVLANGSAITYEHLPASVRGTDHPEGMSIPRGKTLKKALQDVEQKIIRAKLLDCNWNQTRAAEELGINRRQLFTKMKNYKIEKPK